MHREIIEKRHWLSEQQYLNALSFCLLLPGPEAMQLATYAGWRRAGLAGVACRPKFHWSGRTDNFGTGDDYIFFGQGVHGVTVFRNQGSGDCNCPAFAAADRAMTMTDIGDWSVAALAFIGIFFLDLPFPLILLAAAIFGVFGKVSGENGTAGEQANTVQPSATRTVMTVAVGLAIWLLPLLGTVMLAGQTVRQSSRNSLPSWQS